MARAAQLVAAADAAVHAECGQRALFSVEDWEAVAASIHDARLQATCERGFIFGGLTADAGSHCMRTLREVRQVVEALRSVTPERARHLVEARLLAKEA